MNVNKKMFKDLQAVSRKPPFPWLKKLTFCNICILMDELSITHKKILEVPQREKFRVLWSMLAELNLYWMLSIELVKGFDLKQ